MIFQVLCIQRREGPALKVFFRKIGHNGFAKASLVKFGFHLLWYGIALVYAWHPFIAPLALDQFNQCSHFGGPALKGAAPPPDFSWVAKMLQAPF